MFCIGVKAALPTKTYRNQTSLGPSKVVKCKENRVNSAVEPNERAKEVLRFTLLLEGLWARPFTIDRLWSRGIAAKDR